jgi:hypothetical protein
VALEAAVAAPGGHVAAELVGLPCGVVGADHGNLHDLLLEEGDSEGPVQDGGEAGVRGGLALLAFPAAEIGVDHAALDGAGADDRDLHDEVVELAGLEAREHGHLRAALDLEYTDCVGGADGVVDLRVLGRDPGHRLDGVEVVEALSLLDVEEGQSLANGGEHAEAEDVDLEEAEIVEIVLVPRDDRAVLHAGGLDRGDAIEGLRREDEAADVDGEVAREALDLVGQLEHELEAAIAGVEADAREVARIGGIRAAVAREAAQAIELIEREAEDLADLAQGALAAVADDLGHHRGAVAAVGLVDGLDDLLAALVLEVDVDVRRLVALGGEEALEEEVTARGVDRGDAEDEAHGAVRGAAAALAQDLARARHLDDLRQQATEAAIAVMIADQQEDRARGASRRRSVVLDRELRAADELASSLLHLAVRADEPVDAVAIGDADRR